MVRSAAKNWKDVAVLTDASQYAEVVAELKAGGISSTTRFKVGGCLQPHQQLRRRDQQLPVLGRPERRRPGDEAAAAAPCLPGQCNENYVKLQDLRYGENPHQARPLPRHEPGAWLPGHRRAAAGQGAVLQQHRRCRRGLGMRQELRRAGLRDRQACQPCGVAVGSSAFEAYCKAFQTDPTSAFGGIIAFNRPLDGEAAQAVSRQFVEVLIATDFTPEALAVFRQGQRAPDEDRTAARRCGNQPQRGRHQAHRFRPAAAERRQPRHDAGRPQGRDSQAAQPAADGRPAVCLEGGQVRQVQRDRVLQGRHDHGCRRRPDESPRFGTHRQHQGRARQS